MDDFQEYITTLNPPISQQNLDILKQTELNTRTLKLPTDEIVKELILHGMNRLTALDIVTSAQNYFREQEKHLQYPLGIFWDVENIRIPTRITGEEASDKIKQVVRSFGNPVLCNAYFESSDQSTMVPAKRQKLQQCGWNLMDVPHLTKKEVADKVIIVDILLFILDHSKDPQAHCTVCLISDDTDFSYLLAKLKSYPQVKTVVISKDGELLKMNADASMRWGLDVLKFPFTHENNTVEKETNEEERNTRLPTAVPTTASNRAESVFATTVPAASTQSSLFGSYSEVSSQPRLPTAQPLNAQMAPPQGIFAPAPFPKPIFGNNSSNTSVDAVVEGNSTLFGKPSTVFPTAPVAAPINNSTYVDDDDDVLSCSEAAVDEYDRNQLIKVLRDLNMKENKREHLKSLVGILLKNANPQAYGDRAYRNAIFEKGIQDGVVIQQGSLGNVTLELARKYW